MEFYKYEAAQNDFILVDLLKPAERNEAILEFLKKSARMLCDRRLGIGADGILVLALSDRADAFMHIINSDGSIAAMCGNGIRCAARYLYKRCIHDLSRPLFIDTLGGLQHVRYISGDASEYQIEVAMDHADIAGRCEIVQSDKQWCGIQVDVGNPHAVFETNDPDTALAEAGEFLSNHPHFPDRSNIEFIRAVGENALKLTVYERGAGPTPACGTGCVAAAVAYCSAHHTSGIIQIHAPGGDLSVTVPENHVDRIRLCGPARFVFRGSLDE